MTSPFDRPLPPLRDLPPPPRLPEDSSSLVPPGEIIAESERAITRRLLAIVWMPALVLIALWYALLTLFVFGASPTMWTLSALSALVEPSTLRYAMASLGFSSNLLWTAYLFLPAVATALSVPLLPVATQVIAGMNPRHHLGEQGFQRAVATRVTAVLMIPPVLITAALPVAVVLGAPLPWAEMGTGPLLAMSLGVGAIMLAWISIRAWVTAPRVLGIEAAATLQTTARLDRDHDRRREAARQVLAQDRRHLPPNPGTPQAHGALSPRGALRALALIGRSSLVWLWPAVIGLGWIVFSVADFSLVIGRLAQFDLTQVPSALRWPVVAVGAPVLALVLAALALTPAAAIRAARGQRDQVRDQRTYKDWAHRARVNPWEARVVTLTGVFAGAVALAGTAVFAAVLSLVGAHTPLSWTWVVLDVLVVAPMLGLAAAAAMRGGLRDVVYGPAWWYMRRESPYALVAPDVGTRAQRAEDPAVRAELRRRLQEQAGDHTLEIFDLDTAGERLWVDDSLPGATATTVRADDVERGRLPDFGAEGSPLAAPSPDADDPDGIPDSVTDLRER